MPLLPAVVLVASWAWGDGTLRGDESDLPSPHLLPGGWMRVRTKITYIKIFVCLWGCLFVFLFFCLFVFLFFCFLFCLFSFVFICFYLFSLDCLFVRSFVLSFFRSFVRSFVCSFVRSFVSSVVALETNTRQIKTLLL